MTDYMFMLFLPSQCSGGRASKNKEIPGRLRRQPNTTCGRPWSSRKSKMRGTPARGVGTAITRTCLSQGSNDYEQNCPYGLLTEQGGQVSEATSRCCNHACHVCPGQPAGCLRTDRRRAGQDPLPVSLAGVVRAHCHPHVFP